MIGGVEAGWPEITRLAQPIRIEAHGAELVPAVEGVAQFMATLPHGRAIAQYDTSFDIALLDPDVIDSNFAGTNYIMTGNTIDGAELRKLQRLHVRYIVLDRRVERSGDALTGMTFWAKPPVDPADRLYPATMASRFDAVGSRIYDDGDITVYRLDG